MRLPYLGKKVEIRIETSLHIVSHGLDESHCVILKTSCEECVYRPVKRTKEQ